jgi:hypothetical protein
MGDSQSQKAGESALQIQAHGNVTITYGVSYAELDLKIAEARREIAQEVLSKAQEMLREAGAEPRPVVPLKTVVPLLQYASLEEDEDLQERWAALLANAVGSSDVHPFFPQALSQLGPIEARLLDFMYGHAMKFSGPRAHDPERDLKEHDFGVAYQEYVQITKSSYPPYSPDWQKVTSGCLASLNLLISLGFVSAENPHGCAPNLCSYRINALGSQFVRACRKPTGVDAA